MSRGEGERRGLWFSVAIAIIRPSMLLLTRRRRRGWEHLPATGGVIVVANHVSAVDPLTVAHAVYDGGRLPHYLAKETLFRMFFVGSVMRGADQIPVHRDTTDAGNALRDAVIALEQGYCVVIYPEGTTTRDPDLWPMRARTGVARLALTSGAPVLPLAQWGPHRIHRRGGRLHPLARPVVTSVLGPPVDLSRWRDAPQTPRILRAVTDEIMGTVTAMLADIRGETPPATPYTWRPSKRAA